jgi:hypothetical protein
MKFSKSVIFALTCLASTAAYSIPVSYEFTGTVRDVIDRVNPVPPVDIQRGSTFSGTFTYDWNQEPLSHESENSLDGPSEYLSVYAGGAADFQIDELYRYEAVPVGDKPVIEIYNDHPALPIPFFCSLTTRQVRLGTIPSFDSIPALICFNSLWVL